MKRTGSSVKGGFTLVELLMVAAAAAILISILLCYGAHAAVFRRQETCLSNLIANWYAMAIYAPEFRARLPAYMIKDSRPQPIPRPLMCSLAFEKDPDSGEMIPGNMMGFTRIQGTTEIPSVVYCPSRHARKLQEWGFASASFYPEPWGSDTAEPDPKVDFHPDGRAWIATGYWYNPHLVKLRGQWYHRYRDLERSPEDKILMMDVMGSTPDWVTHYRNGPSWNVLFMDGSAVNLRLDQDVLDRFMSGHDLYMTYSNERMNAFLEMLEARVEIR